MGKKILISVALLIITVMFLVLKEINSALFNLYVAVLAFICTYEVSQALGDKINDSQKMVAIWFPIVAIGVITFFPKIGVAFVVLALTAVVVSSVFTNGAKISKTAYFLFNTFYPTVPLITLCYLNLMGKNSLFTLITVFSVVAFSDVFGQIFNKIFKGRKLFYKFDSQKTVLQIIGGVLGGITASLLTYFILKEVHHDVFYDAKTVNAVLFIVVTGIFFSVVCQFGEIFESYLKKQLGLKNSDALISNYGGLLNKIGGLVSTSVCAYFIYSFLF